MTLAAAATAVQSPQHATFHLLARSGKVSVKAQPEPPPGALHLAGTSKHAASSMGPPDALAAGRQCTLGPGYLH